MGGMHCAMNFVIAVFIAYVCCVCSLKDPLLEAVLIADVPRVLQLLQTDQTILSSQVPVIIDRLEKVNNRTALLQCGLDPQTSYLDILDADCANIASMLLKSGANVHHVDKNQWNAVAMGAVRGLTAYISVLAEHGADVNSKDVNGRTPLMKAVTHGHLVTVRKLLELRANACDVDKHRWSALHFAVRQVVQHHEIFMPVLEHMSSVAQREGCVDVADEDGRTPLMYAALEGIVEAVEVLLAGGADSRLVDRRGYSAYDLTDRPDIRAILAEASVVRTMQEHEKWSEGQRESVKWEEL